MKTISQRKIEYFFIILMLCCYRQKHNEHKKMNETPAMIKIKFQFKDIQLLEFVLFSTHIISRLLSQENNQFEGINM